MARKKCAADVFAISRRFSSARVELDWDENDAPEGECELDFKPETVFITKAI